MKIEYLQDFLVFSQFMNYSRAARKLYTTQPSLSNHIHALEREIGTRLVTGGLNPSLTAAGRELVSRGSEMLEHFSVMLDAVRAAGESGMDITILTNDATMGALANLKTLNASYLLSSPDAFVHLDECTDSSVASALSNTDADAVACYNAPLESDVAAGIAFVQIPDLLGATFGLWMHREHPLASVEHLRWCDIAELNHPLPTRVCRLWANTTKEFLTKRGIRVHSRLIADDTMRFFLEIKDDEVQLFDTGMLPILQTMGPRTRILKLLEGEGSRSLLFLGYDPNRVSADLRRYLDFIDSVSRNEAAQFAFGTEL